jgi:hypothetical protein
MREVVHAFLSLVRRSYTAVVRGLRPRHGVRGVSDVIVLPESSRDPAVIALNG